VCKLDSFSDIWKGREGTARDAWTVGGDNHGQDEGAIERTKKRPESACERRKE